MKLYVWAGVLCDQSCGVMFALANSVDEARDAILKADGQGSWAVHMASDTYDGRLAEELQSPPEEYDAPIGFRLWGGG